jgi:ketopantoate reductase
MTNGLVLPVNSGITQVSNTNANVLVFQNGQKLIPTVQYIISGSTIGINVDTHYDGANYEVVVNGVTKG